MAAELFLFAYLVYYIYHQKRIIKMLEWKVHKWETRHPEDGLEE